MLIALVVSPVTAPFATLDLGAAHEIPMQQVLDPAAAAATNDLAKDTAALLSASSGDAAMRPAPADAAGAVRQARLGAHVCDCPDLSDSQAPFRQVLRM